jgi:acetyl esterase/lipase
MKCHAFILVALVALIGCDRDNGAQPVKPVVQQPAKIATLTEARKGFKSKFVADGAAKDPIPDPPAGLFKVVKYESSAGKFPAYLTPDPKDGKKHPAIIWITGGDCNSIGDSCFQPGPPSNDQSASAFREAGIIMMFPSLRGGNENPGPKEGFLGEVDDVIAATRYLCKQDYVDPGRIYLGGHSTGGTLAMLVAECSDRYRAVFAFGPLESVADYGPEYLPFDTTKRDEIDLRSPGQWLDSIKNPTFAFEGTVKTRSNIGPLEAMAAISNNSQIRFLRVAKADHFSVLAPTTRLIAAKILRDDGPICNLTFSEAEVAKPFKK